MAKIVTGQIVHDGLAIILDIGFVPDIFELWNDEGTSPDLIQWFREEENLATSGASAPKVAGTKGYGFVLTGSTGVVTKISSGAGVTAYDAAINGVKLPAPNGIGKREVAVIEYADASTPTARTVAITGTCVRPSTRNGYVYECTTSSGAVVTEPTWPTTPGGTVTDDGSNVWICREEEVATSGAKGVNLEASMSQNTDGNRGWYKAILCDKYEDKGDAGNHAAGTVI